ncbi:MAG TPA: DEAD/DEAH box helicase, partial [Candidatus Obscuribacterales bacterium]
MDHSPAQVTAYPDLKWAHPLVAEWFLNKFGSPSEPQAEGWPHILAGRATLISAPTGSGKTLAAFLACIDRLVRKALDGELQNRTAVLYVSPLKALSNDIQRNLEVPLKEIQQLAIERGHMLPEIRAAVRTGDTLMPERQSMLRKPPHILVTTPESLYILLTAEKSRAMLKSVETVIVDEIHAVADDKRGAHLALSLERLEVLTSKRPVRIGLSATQKPIETIAEFLAGTGRPLPVIVNTGHRRQLDLAVEVPSSPLGAVASNEMWDEIYDRVAQLVGEHRSTLVFVNTRRLAERVAHHLAERLGEEAVAAHHGSLSRKLRHSAEKKLKAGELQVVVATASLELGIDVGTVDLVIQIGSPRSVSVALQRVGRAGHWRGAIPKGRLFATTRDELVECAALVRAVGRGELDEIIVPEAPLDILAQQIVAACATGDWTEDDLYGLVRFAYPYRNLTREQFDSVIEMLSEGFAGRNFRYGAYLHRDRVNGRLRARRGSRMTAITCGGAIPENSLFSMVAEPEGTIVGTLDEDFAVESNRGDIILLGSTSWRIRRVESKAGRVIVEDAHGAPPSVPFWRGEAPARTAELSARVAEVRKVVSDMTPCVPAEDVSPDHPEAAAAITWLKQECGLDDAGAEQVVTYVVQGRAVLGTVPTQTTVVAERFFDESGGMQLVIHAPFGGRINKAWGLALRKRFCTGFNLELQAAATDDGLNIALSEQHSFPLADVFRFLHPETLESVLEQAAVATPIFTSRWRWDTTRALSVLRFQGGKKVPPQIQRMRAEDLLAVVFPDAAACQDNIDGPIRLPDHPLVNEVMKDVLTEALDLEGLRRVISDVVEGRIKCIAVDTPVPSQFSHEILNANPYAYLDDAPLEERRARAVEMRRVLPDSVLEEVGALDPAAIKQVRAEAWPDVRDADELHDALLTLIAIPEISWPPHAAERASWGAFFNDLAAQRRAATAVCNGRSFWVAAEKARTFLAAFPDAEFKSAPADVEAGDTTPEEAVLALVKGWMMHLGPATADDFVASFGLPRSAVEQALLRLESAGMILRGKFTDPHFPETEWCERRLLARIHRLTVGTLRRLIEPVSAAQFMRWLTQWQHVAPGSQLAAERGTLEILRQLQGFEIPASAWEQQILPRRIRNYDPADLDRLCLTGIIGWGRLSPHPATLEKAEVEADEVVEAAEAKTPRKAVARVIPTSAAPITFFLREEAEWMALTHRGQQGRDGRGLSHAARQVMEYLAARGASFFLDIARDTGQLKAETETALWELVTAGHVTADG